MFYLLSNCSLMDIHSSCRLCRTKISVTVEKYTTLYFECTSKENRTTENAQKFLNKNYKSFRKEIVEIGVDTLYSCKFSKEVRKVVNESYRWGVAKLFIEIVFSCTGTINSEKKEIKS